MEQNSKLIEHWKGMNTKLDADFAHEMQFNNDLRSEAHQLLYSVENVYELAREFYKYRGHEKKFKETIANVEDKEPQILKIERNEPAACQR